MSVGKGKPPVKNQFKKGQSGNPLGAKAHNQDLIRVRRMTHADIAKVGALVVDGNIQALKDLVKNPESTVLQVWMATIAIKGIEQGDMTKLDGLLSRIVGKTKTEIVLTPMEQDTNPDPKNIDAIEAQFRILQQKTISHGPNS